MRKIAQCIRKYLEIDDDELTLSKFLLNLYKSSESNTFESFRSVLDENGGDEFPTDFKKEVYELLASRKGNFEKKSLISALQLPNPETKPETNPELNPPKSPETNPPKSPEPNPERNPPTDTETTTDSDTSVRIGNIYRGLVSNITAFGAFIRIGPMAITGLCHISKLAFDGRRTRHVEDVVKLRQTVFVRVDDISRDGRKISLSMVGIDQNTGLDRRDEITEHPRGRSLKLEKQDKKHEKKRRRLTSPERWEIRQLINSGAADPADYPELNGYNNDHDGDEDVAHQVDRDDDIDVDIELNPAEPTFLKGQLGPESLALKNTPVQIVKNPEGSMSRAAMSGSKLAQQVREEQREAQRNVDRTAREIGTDISDPMQQKPTQPRTKETSEFISEWKKSQKLSKILYGKRTTLPIAEQRRQLPVYSMRQELVEAIRNNQFLVIVGETGSGKTTQIVQYAYEEGLNVTTNSDGTKTAKIIGCTQPRRVAAVSVAKRVAEEVGCKVGQQVGYYIRFEDETGPDTRIKYMTDGMLQREALLDPTMSKYSLIMLDEAHERTVATDVLFALLKKAAQSNPELKVIVTSATLDSEKFSGYFYQCPVMKIPGRTFPVEVMFSRQPEMDYLAAALDCVMQIHVSEGDGDILVFLTGQEEIDTSCEVLFSRMKTLGNAIPELIILPVYSALPSEMQSRIFDPAPPGARKVVLATNIAETSITIDGIRFVVDPGYVKLNAYDPRIGMDLLVVSPISQAQANQRAGRAGRTGPGKCFRLYTENAYNNEMLASTIPEIQRQNLSLTILMLKAMGINDLISFEFMDPPPPQTMVNALHDLYTLDALDDSGYLTRLGKRMSEFPMEPALAKTLIASVDFGCTEEVLTIVAMLSVQLVFYRPKDKQTVADQRKQRFHSVHGDHLTLLNVYRAWELNGRSVAWCKENFIHDRSLRRAYDVRRQLVTIMRKFKVPILSAGMDTSNIRKCFCSGYFKNTAKRDPHDGTFNTLIDQTPVSLHPLSSLMGKSLEYVLYHSVLLTTREYMQCVSVIDGKWLPELAPRFFRRGDPSRPSDVKRTKKIVPLYNRFTKDQDAWRLTSQVEAKKKALELLNED